MGPDEEGVEPGEDPEHLVGVLGGAELEEKVGSMGDQVKTEKTIWQHGATQNVPTYKTRENQTKIRTELRFYCSCLCSDQ